MLTRLPLSRRDMLRSTSIGFGALAFSGLCAEQIRAEARGPLSPKQPHFPAKAKRVIFMCMRGAPAQVDTFDYKPRDRQVASTNISPKSKGKSAGKGRAGSVIPFSQHRESGLWIADTMPNLAKHADELCLINSMYTDLPNHPQSYLMMHTGDFRFARPSVGAWTLYGLGTENQNLPGFISINAETRVGGAQNYGSAVFARSLSRHANWPCWRRYHGSGDSKCCQQSSASPGAAPATRFSASHESRLAQRKSCGHATGRRNSIA